MPQRKTWLDKRRSVTGYLIKNARAAGGQAIMIRTFPSLCRRAASCSGASAPAASGPTQIERVVSPGGIEAWLVASPRCR